MAQLNEQFLRMQKLAGVITESQYNKKMQMLNEEITVGETYTASMPTSSDGKERMDIKVKVLGVDRNDNNRFIVTPLEDKDYTNPVSKQLNSFEKGKQYGVEAEFIKESLNEEANTDLELKSVAKKVFSVLKKYGLKPNYSDKGDVKLDKAYDSVVALVTDPDTNTGLIKVNIWAWAASNNKIDMGKLNSDITGVLGNEFENKSGKTTVGNDIVYNMLIRKKQ
jgi:hypothetical protein